MGRDDHYRQFQRPRNRAKPKIIRICPPYTERELDIIAKRIPAEETTIPELQMLRSKAYHMNDADAFRFANALLIESGDDTFCDDPFETAEKVNATLDALRPPWLREIMRKVEQGETISRADLPEVLVGAAKDIKPTRRSPVNQYDLDGKYIRTFESCYDAASYCPDNPDGRQIHKAAKGETAYAYSFQWRFESDEYPAGQDIPSLTNTYFGLKLGKRVYQVDDNGCVVAEYASLTEAADTVKCKVCSISTAARYMRKCRGFYWVYNRSEQKGPHKPKKPPKPSEPAKQQTVPKETDGKERKVTSEKRIAQYDLEGNYIAEFPSLTKAAAYMDCSVASISIAAKKGTPCKGYHWKIEPKETTPSG